MCTSENFTGERHGVFVTLVALSEFRLTFGDKADDFNRSCPSVLNKRAVLDFKVQPRELLAYIGIDVVLVNVMDSPVPRLLWALYVVVLVQLVSTRVIETGFVKVLAERL